MPAKTEDALSALMVDRTMPTRDRAQAMVYMMSENPADCSPAVHRLLEVADEGHRLKEKYEAVEGNPLVMERYLGRTVRPPNRVYAMMTRGTSDICVPATEEELEGLRRGDAVLFDVKAERIVGRDGDMPTAGDVVEVESCPRNQPGMIVVKHHDKQIMSRVHHQLEGNGCVPGDRVLFDPMHRFVLDQVDAGTDGNELLMDPDRIARVHRDDIGSPKPIIDEIMDRIRLFVSHRDWLEKMRVRMRCSYLFVGCTGSGKSFHLKYLATRLHDYVEQLTGTRSGRVVMVDASQFWSPYFGETEQRISQWAERLESLGSQVLRDRDGHEVRVPLCVVMEEFESLMRSRGENSSSGHLFDRPLALLLQKTESLESSLNVPIVWLASSNRGDLVDPAALRRFGTRQVVFGTLAAAETLSVLERKIPEDMPLSEGTRQAVAGRIVAYLFGSEPHQGVAELTTESSDREVLERQELVTPALLEEAVSFAVDQCLRRSLVDGRLVGLDTDDVIDYLHRHFVHLAKTLRPHNLADHCPHWTANGGPRVVRIVPLASDTRRPLTLVAG